MTRTDECWRPMMELLEQFEYWPIHHRSGRWWLLLSSLMMIGGGIWLFLWAASGTDETSIPINFVAPIFAFTACVLILVGSFLLVSSLPSTWFAKISMAAERHVWTFSTTFSVISTACLLFVSTVVVVGALTHQIGFEQLTTLTVMAITLAAVVRGLGNRSVRIGISSHRARMRNAIWSRRADTTAFICITAVVAAILPEGIDPVAVALPATLTILGSHLHRAKSFDETISSFITITSNIRRAGVNAAVSPQNSDAMADLYDQVRELHLVLASHPRMLASPLNAHGFTALCSLADVRATDQDIDRHDLKGAKRAKSAHAVLSLTDSDFALGIAQLFDAVLRQTTGNLSPTGTSTSPQLKVVLETAALPRPARAQVIDVHGQNRPSLRRFRRLFGLVKPNSFQEPASMSRTIGLTFEP